MEGILADFRFAVRTLRKNPKFVVVALFSLALGIGINSIIFGLVDALILRPFPFNEPDRMIRLSVLDVTRNARFSFSSTDYLRLKKQTRTLSKIVAKENGGLIIRNEAGTELFLSQAVSEGYFQLLNIRPQLGRFFTPEDSSENLLVISYSVWKSRFAADPGVIGRRVSLYDGEATIIGVAPKGFTGTERIITADMWYPLESGKRWTDLNSRDHVELQLEGQLAPGVTLEQCRAEMNALSPLLTVSERKTTGSWRIAAIPASDYTGIGDGGSEGKRLAYLLMALTGMVLLIACVNVSALFFAKFEERKREIAIRFAVGASRGRLIRLLMIESLLLASAGAVLCLALCYTAIDGMRLFIPTLPFSLDPGFRVDYRVAAYTLLISFAATLVFGLTPTLRCSKIDLTPVMKGETVKTSRSRLFVRSGLLVGQLAVSLVLLITSSVLILGFVRGLHADLGFQAREMLLVTVVLDQDHETAATWRQLVDNVRALTGVKGVTWAKAAPLALSGTGTTNKIFLPNDEATDEGRPTRSNIVAEDYFRLMGIRILHGREFSSEDTPSSRKVAVISQSMAERFWPNANPIGQTFNIRERTSAQVEVVGIAHEVISDGFRAKTEPHLYLAAAQNPLKEMTLIVASSLQSGQTAAAIRQIVKTVDPGAVIVQTTSLRDNIRFALLPNQIAAGLFGSFGALALILASIGLYGVVSFTIKQRTNEIGIRLALGAQPRQVLILTMRRGAFLALLGSSIGILIALPIPGGLGGDFYGTQGGTAPAFLASTLILLAVILLANFIPAWRASRMAPTQALRYE